MTNKYLEKIASIATLKPSTSQIVSVIRSLRKGKHSLFKPHRPKNHRYMSVRKEVQDIKK